MVNLSGDSRYTNKLARPLAHFELLLNAAIGFTWGPLLFYFLLRIADWTRPVRLIATFGLMLSLAFLGVRAPTSYFRLGEWERAGAGRFYVRYFGIRAFKSWMSHGDRMNAWLRCRIAGYRIVRHVPGAAAAYAARTVAIERAHLAWGLAALAPLGYALTAGAYGFAGLLVLANAVTNVWPILLQRYNRVRAERITAGKSGGA